MMCAYLLLVCCVILEFIQPSSFYLVYSFSRSLNSYLVYWKANCLFIFHILSDHIFRLQTDCQFEHKALKIYRVYGVKNT